MVIRNFNIIGIAVFPFETNAPLPIDADAALAGAVAAPCIYDSNKKSGTLSRGKIVVV